MKLNETLSRWKSGLASAALALSLVSGSASADIDGASLFFIALDADRGGSQESYAIDLNFDFLANDPSTFSTITDAGLASWLSAPNASGLISWGVFGIGNNGSAEAFRIASTVNPADTPNTLSQSDIGGAIAAGGAYISSFNAAVGGGESVQALQGQAGFPQGFGDGWGGITDGNFSSMGGLDEMLEMFVFAIENESPFAGQPGVPYNGFWKLDASLGSLEFAPVPIPAAVWLFGTALAGLFGARRRAAA